MYSSRLKIIIPNIERKNSKLQISFNTYYKCKQTYLKFYEISIIRIGNVYILYTSSLKNTLKCLD